MVVRRKGQRAEHRARVLASALVAGSALALGLSIGGPAAADPGILVRAVAPVPTAVPGGVTFEVLPVPPSGTPTGQPTPSPTASGDLPVTGGDSTSPSWLLAAGALLFLIGALIVATSRGVRRRRA
ncbi:hypothetical protein BDK92_3814 [Micromonospora pisi]|uniref:Gram-positive cocci surface proteins LPxTG domain-containing protein n=1 Tax=Micromonospora pisi TaxID=589240 RepID=A0A495JKC9_9ACTN|nr:hypothetical protein [Micromonospora pisi]RKR89466.1 hypothetical protein BDK92_3814 [Micromonospora pisi]